MKLFIQKLMLIGFLSGIAYMAGIVVVGALWKNHLAKQTQVELRYSSIVRLVDSRTGQTFCSGTVISDMLIITAAHCVTLETEFGSMLNTENIEVRPADNTRLNTFGKAIFASPQMDQAILLGYFTKYAHSRYITDPKTLDQYGQNSDNLRNTNFISCGYPLGGELFCTNTKFSEQDGFFWGVKGLLLPGMSGGPTMLLDGTLVAVNIAVAKDHSIVTPIYNITKNIILKSSGK